MENWSIPQLHINMLTLSRCRELLTPYGLKLTEENLRQLEEARICALRETDRIEFEGGILEALLMALRASPYLMQDELTDTLSELQTLFYTFKGVCGEKLPDTELIDTLCQLFNGPAHGSTDLIAGLSGKDMLHIARTGVQSSLFYGGADGN